jgi:hypothetical protein
MSQSLSYRIHGDRRLSICLLLGVLAFAPPAAADDPAAQTAAAGDSASSEHPLKPAIRLAQASLDALQSVDDYEAVITRRELVNGEFKTETMQMKFRQEPFSVYLLFGGEKAGREVIYVDGENNNELLAHEGSGFTSFFGTISLKPDNPQVLAESRHKITDIGLRNMISAISKRWEEESQFGECDVKYYQQAKVNEMECLAIECTHPRPRRQFQFHISRLFLDKQTNFPIRVENWGFPAQPGAKPALVEEYTYSELKTNVGLTDLDFSRDNPAYKF